VRYLRGVRPSTEPFASYPKPGQLEQRWRDLVYRLGGRETVVGSSVQGRPLWRFDIGPEQSDRPPVLLTALIHGVEVIGSLALYEVMSRLRDTGAELRERTRFVVMPVLNPDALAANMAKLARGRPAARRKNANGVDLNRNFPTVGSGQPWHPFAGSNLRLSPHYRGPHPLSEPESRAVYQVATEVRPSLSLGFHSFGNMLLYPWGHTRALNPRIGPYRRLAQAFSQAVRQIPYRCGQAIDFYPTAGDLDDWLDDQLGTLALTIEVGKLSKQLFHPLRLLNAFWWMNPMQIEPTVRNVSPGVLDLIRAAVLSPVPA
jgi:carboxypeptidase T